MKLKNNKGMTLLEVLISMIVLSVGVLGLAPLVVLSIEANTVSRDAMAVSSLAKERIEFFEDPANIPALPFGRYEQGLDSLYNRYTYIWDNATDTTIADGLCHILVTISWQDKTGAQRSSQYLSVISKG
jgi:type IV pilus assembly protein PilV